MRRSWLAGLAALILASWAQTAHAAPPLWKIHGRHGAEITLFGASPNATLNGPWRTQGFDEALAGADEIWFENPDKPGPVTALRAFGVISMHGSLPEGKTLSPMLSPDGRARMVRLAGKLGVDVAKLDRMQPWWADLTLTFAFGDKMRPLDRNGVERYVKAHAPKGVRFRAFDTALRDLQALAASPVEEQIADLEYANRRREAGADTLEPALEDWLAGDVAKLSATLAEPFRARAPRSFGPFVTERHRIWAEDIERLSGGERHVLIIVGIPNLVGPDSLPAMLRKRGVSVEGP